MDIMAYDWWDGCQLQKVTLSRPNKTLAWQGKTIHFCISETNAKETNTVTKCHKWKLYNSLNISQRNPASQTRAFPSKTCKCFSFYNQCTRCSSKMSWLTKKIVQNIQPGLSPKLLLPKLEPFGDLAADQWRNMMDQWNMECVIQYLVCFFLSLHVSLSIDIDFRIQTPPGKITPLELLTGRPSTSSSSS